MRLREQLSAKKIDALKPGPKRKKVADGDNLSLWVEPSGGKLWSFGYRFDGKERRLAIGAYPSVGLSEARAARRAAEALLAAGKDPQAVKRAAKEANLAVEVNLFGTIADEFIAKRTLDGLADRSLQKTVWLLAKAKAALGSLPIAEIKAGAILAVLKVEEAAGRHETASRLRETIGQVFRFAVATDRAETDPTSALRGALITPKVQHRAAILDPEEFAICFARSIGSPASPSPRRHCNS
jgi:Arm DNA-binding domain